MRKRVDCTLAELKRALDYDPETGIFTWRYRANVGGGVNARFAGKRAGCWTRDYVLIGLNGRFYQAHRLAWFYHYGEWPSGPLDHIDRNGSNNAIRNLRICTAAQNGWNRSVNKKNISGYKGVAWHGKNNNWTSAITFKGRRHYLGSYSDPYEAHLAYQAKAKELFGSFATSGERA